MTPSTTWSLVRMKPSRLTITPEPSESWVSGGRLKRSPKKRWNAGSSSSGLRRRTWRVAEMLTTDGIAFLAASLKEKARAPTFAAVASEPGAGATGVSRTSTTWVRQASHSGFTRLTTKITARVKVTAWAKTSQSLRIAGRNRGEPPIVPAARDGWGVATFAGSRGSRAAAAPARAAGAGQEASRGAAD